MKTIVVPTDFSPAATNALQYALELSKYFNSKLVLVNSYPVPSTTYDSVIPLEMTIAMQQASEEALDAIKKNYPEHKIECYSAMGFAYDVIETATEKYKADLIVMGIVGEAGTLKKHLIGSTSIKVAKKLKVPTFIIPEGVTYHHIHKISFACDFDKTEETTLVYTAKCFGKLFDAEIDIINVEKPFEINPPEKKETKEFLDKKLQAIKHQLIFIGNEDITDGIEDYIQGHPTDVLMLNPKKHNIFHNMFVENVTKELVFKVKLPVLVIH